ncbi:MAG: glycosyltransferase [Lachnospiraceae bacterium]|nr:glycosyltransferase [Lachnospiraceae bacterium]
MNRIKRIIMFKGDIETTGYFSEQMAAYFKKQGYQIYFYDYQHEKKCITELLRFYAQGETAVVSFNFHGITGKEELFFDRESNTFMWEDLDIPFLNIVVDHPYYYHRFLDFMPPQYMNLSIDRNHEKYLTRYYPEIKQGPFLPLAGTSLHPAGDYKKMKDRAYDISFAANYSKPETFDVFIERHGPEYTAFYHRIIDELLEDPTKLLEDVAYAHIMAEVEDAAEDPAGVKLALSNMIFIDMYVRYYFRGEMVRTLVDNGYKVQIFGSGWDELSCKHPENMILGGGKNSLECLKLQTESKVSLNNMPWFKDGAHDRVFNTMLNGAVCCTDSSVYMDEFLKDGENCIIYDLSHMDELPDKVGALLADEERMQHIADAGFTLAKNGHTWADRAKVVNNVLSGIR